MVSSPSRKERIRVIHDTFMALMWIAKRQFAQQLQAFGLTHPQFITMVALVAHQKSCTMRDLINVTFQDAPTVTGIVDRLIKMNLVERTRSEVDRRVVLVQATSAGVDLVRQIEEKFLHDGFCEFNHLTDENLNAMEQLLTYFLRTLLSRFANSPETDLKAELEKFFQTKNNSIHFINLEPDPVIREK